MKEKYEDIEIEIILLGNSDIITDSTFEEAEEDEIGKIRP